MDDLETNAEEKTVSKSTAKKVVKKSEPLSDGFSVSKLKDMTAELDTVLNSLNIAENNLKIALDKAEAQYQTKTAQIKADHLPNLEELKNKKRDLVRKIQKLTK